MTLIFDLLIFQLRTHHIKKHHLGKKLGNIFYWLLVVKKVMLFIQTLWPSILEKVASTDIISLNSTVDW